MYQIELLLPKEKKKKKPKQKDLFEIDKKIKCPKGYKVCRCNPKKPKCKKIKKVINKK